MPKKTTPKDLTPDQIKKKVNELLSSIDDKITTKFANTVNKTRRGTVPSDLFQERTSRTNRTLISWKTVKSNNLTMANLESFSGGVVVEFINEDWTDPANQKDPVFIALKAQLGSDDTVSSIISFRSESGLISSSIPKTYFDKFIAGTKLKYKGATITVNASNYQNYILSRDKKGGSDNSTWSGFLYYSIKGGVQKTENSHGSANKILLFNPACEFASKSVANDIFIMLSYFALKSIDIATLSAEDLLKYNFLITEVEKYLRKAEYDSPDYTGNLLDYCNAHPSLTIVPGKLYDPIQMEEIHIQDFAIDAKDNPRNLDLTHNEAVAKNKYYWDTKKNCVLTPARPTNFFWSFHESNMMQQNHSLEEYIRLEKQRVEKRFHITIP